MRKVFLTAALVLMTVPVLASTYHMELTGTITNVEAWTNPDWEALGHPKAFTPEVGADWYFKIDTTMPTWDGSRLVVGFGPYVYPGDPEIVGIETVRFEQNIWPEVYHASRVGMRAVLEDYQLVSLMAQGGGDGYHLGFYLEYDATDPAGSFFQQTFNNFVEDRRATGAITGATITHTPEPATLAVTGLALLGLVAIGKRRLRQERDKERDEPKP